MLRAESGQTTVAKEGSHCTDLSHYTVEEVVCFNIHRNTAVFYRCAYMCALEFEDNTLSVKFVQR